MTYEPVANPGGRRQSDQEFSFMLGEILGKVEGIEKYIVSQNGTLTKLEETTTELAIKISQLPCEVHDERLKNHIKNSELFGMVRRDRSPWVHRGSGAGVATVIILAVFELGHLIGFW